MADEEKKDSKPLNTSASALEKQIPKNPVGHWGEFCNIFYTCPACDKKLPKKRKMYCVKCGQSINWGKGEYK